jgi:hypothetical protein
MVVRTASRIRAVINEWRGTRASEGW